MRLQAIVADDDPGMLELVGQALEILGMNVLRVDNGADLVDAVTNKGPIDLIVTDVSMPWMSGIQVALSVRGAGMNMPVIVMTGTNGEKQLSQIKHLGSNTALLRKPFKLNEFNAAVASLLPSRPTSATEKAHC